MSRYIIRPKAQADCDWWDNGRLCENVSVSDSVPVDTGLIDGAGNTIWRVNDPIGF